MRRKKENFIIIVFAVILLLIVFSIAILTFLGASNPANQSTDPVTSFPTRMPTTTTKKSSVVYDRQAQDTLLKKVKNRQQLSQDDTFAKAKILALLPPGKKSGVLYKTPKIIIDYVSSANVFQGEILTTEISQAKAEANIWFVSRGMSQQGICNAPVMFYLNWRIAEKLKATDIVFSPLPNGC